MNDQNTGQLLDRAATEDQAAIGELMSLHRARIRRMLAIRMGQEMSARVDPSDIVQETLVEAARLLPQYLAHRRIAFYPWLRDLAIHRLIDLHRRHVLAARRSTKSEEPQAMLLPDESCVDLAGRLVHSGTSPSGQVEHAEGMRQVKRALERLPDDEREILILKYLEELTATEIADVLNVTERTVWRRHARAIENLGALLAKKGED